MFLWIVLVDFVFNFIFRFLDLIKFSNHKVVKIIVVPDCNEVSQAANEHALHATYVGQKVEELIAISSYYRQILIHLDRYVNLSVFVFFVRLDLSGF